MSNNSVEDELITALDKAKITDALVPTIQNYVQAGGTVDGFLAQCQPVAYAKLASLMASNKEDIALKACMEILNRLEGKPTERKQVLTADVTGISPKQAEQEILRYLELVKPNIELEEPKKSLPPLRSPNRRPKNHSLKNEG